jgi:hypothetical protein
MTEEVRLKKKQQYQCISLILRTDSLKMETEYLMSNRVIDEI